jgi:hypothetical protein
MPKRLIYDKTNVNGGHIWIITTSFAKWFGCGTYPKAHSKLMGIIWSVI